MDVALDINIDFESIKLCWDKIVSSVQKAMKTIIEIFRKIKNHFCLVFLNYNYYLEQLDYSAIINSKSSCWIKRVFYKVKSLILKTKYLKKKRGLLK